MDQGLDTGAILLQRTVPIGPAATAAELHDRLAALGADLMVAALEGLEDGSLHGRPQPTAGVTYAAKLSRAEGRLDWRRPATELARQVRALDPWPGAFAELPLRRGPERVKVLAAEALEDAPASNPGRLLDAGLTVACGRGALRLLRVQRPGRAAMTAAEFLRGAAGLSPGSDLPLSGDAA
jgi:methionyl-tRNA formyltransferase